MELVEVFAVLAGGTTRMVDMAREFFFAWNAGNAGDELGVFGCAWRGLDEGSDG
jgi:hypothetical protein